MLSTLAGVMLNLGLFIVLALLAPLVAGLIIGYLIGNLKKTLVGSAISGFASYGLLFFVTEAATGWTSDPLVLFSAILIMTLLCIAGALIGSILAGRSRDH